MEEKHIAYFGHDLLLDILLVNLSSYYIRGLLGIIVLRYQIRIQNHIAMIRFSVEMGGITKVASRGDICSHRITAFTAGCSVRQLPLNTGLKYFRHLKMLSSDTGQ